MPPLLTEVNDVHPNQCPSINSEKIVLRRASYIKVQDLALPHHIDLSLLPAVIQNAKETNKQNKDKKSNSEKNSAHNNNDNDVHRDEDIFTTDGTATSFTPKDNSDRSKNGSDGSIAASAGVKSANNVHQRINISNEGYNLCVLVGKIDVVVDKLRVDRSRVRLAEVEVGDETGCMSLRARDGQIDLLEKIAKQSGAAVLRNCTVELYQCRHLRLAITKWGKICCYPDNVQSTPKPPKMINRDINLSLVDLVLMEDAINEAYVSPSVTSIQGVVDPVWFEQMQSNDPKQRHYNNRVKRPNQNSRKSQNKNYNHNDNPTIQSYPNPYFTGDSNPYFADSIPLSNYYSGPHGYVVSSHQSHMATTPNRHQQRKQSKRANRKQQSNLFLQQQREQLRQIQQMQQHMFFQQQERQHRMYVHQQQLQQASNLLIPNFMQAMNLENGPNIDGPNRHPSASIKTKSKNGFQPVLNSVTKPQHRQHHSQIHPYTYNPHPTMYDHHLKSYDEIIPMVEQSSTHSNLAQGIFPQQPVPISETQEWLDTGSFVLDASAESSNQQMPNAMMHPTHHQHQVEPNQYGYYPYPSPQGNQFYNSPLMYGQNMMYMRAPHNTGGIPQNHILPEVPNTKTSTRTSSTVVTKPTSNSDENEKDSKNTKMSYAQKAAQKVVDSKKKKSKYEQT